MLLVVVMDARVSAILGPAMASILPGTAITFVVFFSVLAPLSLYRGPLNIWGLGLGLASVMVSTGKLGATSIMAALMTTGQIQGVCDPTNTQNVWTASATGTDVNDIMKKDASLCMGRRCGGPGRSRLSVFLIIENRKTGEASFWLPRTSAGRNGPCRQRKEPLCKKKKDPDRH